MKTLIITIVLSFTSVSAQASFLDDLKQKARPFLVKILGQERTDKLLGKAPEEITLPEIPEVERLATKVTKDLPEKKVNLSHEDRSRYNYVFIKEVIEATRQVQANDNDVAQWLNVMEQGGSREGVYRAMVLDNLYAGLENYQSPVREEVINFTINFYRRYLNKNATVEKLQGVNFYYLKRITTELVLELVDAFVAKNEEDLYRWYAVVSGELAQEHGVAFNLKLRKNDDKKRHFHWAKEVPRQYIKSELIIKIHKIYNKLMI